MKLRALDLFCGAGGASRGLAQAGFEVNGVDRFPQKRYPYRFFQEDALDVLRRLIAGAYTDPLWMPDLIWASPPCQFATEMNNDKSKHLDLLTPTRELLLQLPAHVKWVIENVEGCRQHMRDPVLLCGSMFGLGTNAADAYGKRRFFQLQRHRLFEANFEITQPHPCDHTSPTMGIYGAHIRCRSDEDGWRDGADFPNEDKVALGRKAMGCDKLTLGELSQAIPPAYARHIGECAKKVLLGTANAEPSSAVQNVDTGGSSAQPGSTQ